MQYQIYSFSLDITVWQWLCHIPGAGPGCVIRGPVIESGGDFRRSLLKVAVVFSQVFATA